MVLIKITPVLSEIKELMAAPFIIVEIWCLTLYLFHRLGIKENDIIIKPVTDILIINSYSLMVLIKITPVLSEIKELTAAPFIILIKGARKC